MNHNSGDIHISPAFAEPLLLSAGTPAVATIFRFILYKEV
jgi:hypothetical protein